MSGSNPSHQLFKRDTGYSGSYPNKGGGTQVAISVQRVKSPPKKKRFPITWIRDQYPFNAYYKKQKKTPYNYHNDPLTGQYSTNQEQVEMLDPNPSTWVRIPDRPTATVSFQRQGKSAHVASPITTMIAQAPVVPPSLQFAPQAHVTQVMPVPMAFDQQAFVGQSFGNNPLLPTQQMIAQPQSFNSQI